MVGEDDDITQTSPMPTAGMLVSHYRILEKIGAGGMGEVYLAIDTKLKRKVALKFLSPLLSGDEGCRQRFTLEARAAAGLDHPNIITVHEIGEFRGRPFFAMQYQEGKSLQSIAAEGEIPVEKVLEIITQICEGLQEAHSKDIIHRDLKPANVILSPNGRVKILDFGLAKVLGEPAQTQVESLMGTVCYMSPEQVTGRSVDKRSDVFSVGVMLYELLTGVNPFNRGSIPATLHSIATEKPHELILHRPAIPGECQSILDRVLAKDCDERYQSITELLADLNSLKARYLPLVSATVSNLFLRTIAVPPTQTSIAVLPFVNMSSDPDNEYFAYGLTEELLNVLTKIGNLRVAARTSSFVFRDSREDVRVIGNKLNVETILEGSVRKSGSRVRITVQLVKVSDGYHLWSETYDRTLDDILVVQDDIARSVVQELRTTLLGEKANSSITALAEADVARAVKGRGDNAEAHRLYLRGQYLVERLTREDIDKAMDCFRRAVDLDPMCALAWAGMSRVFADQAGHGWLPCAEGFDRARAAAERALEIEPDLAEGHMRLGLIRMSYDWDWRGALGAIQRALELAPGKASVLRSAAHLASNLNQLDEAIRLLRRVVMLDPLSSTAYHSLGIYCYSAGRLQEAEAALKAALDLNSRQTGLWLDYCRVHLAMGLMEQALAEAEKEVFEPFRLLGLALAHHACGNISDADSALGQLIEKYGEDGAYQIAEAKAFRGDIDGAFMWLESAYRQRDPGLPEMRAEPLLKALHSDPRWPLFMNKLGFTETA